MHNSSANVLQLDRFGRRIYRANFREDSAVAIFANEIQKKHFLDMLLDVRETFPVEIYAYCVLDREVQLLVGETEEGEAGAAVEHLERRYRRYCQPIFGRTISIGCNLEYLGALSFHTVLDIVLEIHRLPVIYQRVQEAEDYWWSSLTEYLMKYRWGIIRPELLLNMLDANPARAVKVMRKIQKRAALQALPT